MLNSIFRQKIARNVWILGLVSLLTDTSSKIIQSLLPLFLVSIGVNLVAIGTIEGIAESTASILKIFSGAISDRLRRRKELAIIGYGLSAAVIPLFALANSATAVLLARFGDRVGKGIRVAPRNALVADSTPPQQRGAAYGLRQSLDTIGAAAGPLLAAGLMLMLEQNYRLVFWLATIPASLAVALLIFGVREETKVHTSSRSLQWGLLRDFSQNYWTLVVVSLLFNLGNFSDAFLLLRSEQIGISPALIPLSFMVINLAYFLSAYPVGIIGDRSNRLYLLVAGFILYALVYAGFAAADANWQIWVLFGFYGLYLGMTKGLLLAMVADCVGDEFRGIAFGGIALATGIVLLPANLLAGVLWQTVGYQAPFWFGSGLATVAALILLLRFRGT